MRGLPSGLTALGPSCSPTALLCPRPSPAPRPPRSKDQGLIHPGAPTPAAYRPRGRPRHPLSCPLPRPQGHRPWVPSLLCVLSLAQKDPSRSPLRQHQDPPHAGAPLDLPGRAGFHSSLSLGGWGSGGSSGPRQAQRHATAHPNCRPSPTPPGRSVRPSSTFHPKPAPSSSQLRPPTWRPPAQQLLPLWKLPEPKLPSHLPHPLGLSPRSSLHQSKCSRDPRPLCPSLLSRPPHLRPLPPALPPFLPAGLTTPAFCSFLLLGAQRGVRPQGRGGGRDSVLRKHVTPNPRPHPSSLSCASGQVQPGSLLCPQPRARRPEQAPRARTQVSAPTPHRPLPETPGDSSC